MRDKRFAIPVALGMGWGLLFSSPGLAQGLEEVLVTARKRTETVQDTPVSVRALSAEQIRRYDMSSLEKISALSPEFSVGRASNGSGAQLTMRGIGSTSTSIGIEQSVAVVVDDVYYGQGRIINEGMFDLGRVELLKGPQALFFGKNATAGVVSLTTADPGQEFELIGRVSNEFEAEQRTGEVIVSGPVTDQIGMRLAVRVSRMAGALFTNRAEPVGYTTSENLLLALTLPTGDPTGTPHTAPPGARDLPGEEEWLGRFTLTYDPTDRLSLKLKASGTRSENDNNSWNYTIYECVGGNSSLNPSIPCGDEFNIYQNDIPPEIAATIPFANSDGSLGNEYDSWQVTGSVDYRFDKLTLTSVTNFQTNENTFICDCDFQSSEGGTYATENTVWEAFSEELRVLTEFDSPINFMLGVFYQRTERDFEQYIAFAGAENRDAEPHNRFLAVSKVSDTEGETISPYFQGIWLITPDIEFSAGARYTRETKDSSFVHPYVHPDLQTAPVDIWREGEVAAKEQTFTEWSPEAAINWAVTEDVMLYAAYKTAYKSGGFSISGLFATDGSVEDFIFGPETAQGFETGAKTMLFDRQLRFNVTAYYYEYDDFQVDFFNSPVFAFTTLNAGEVEVSGVETETEYAPAPLPGLIFRAAVNYNQAEYKDFIAPCWSGQKPSEGCTTTVPGTNAPGQDVSGEPTAVAPEWTASLGADYTLSLPGGLSLGLSLTAQYIDDYNPSSFANPHSRRASYTKYDASVRLAGEGDRWEVALLGKNLTDEHIVTGVVDGPSTGAGTGTEQGVPADQVGFTAYPRTVALQISGRY